MFLELWPDCNYDEEYQYLQGVMQASTEDCFLFRLNNNHIGFLLVSMRHDSVEGASGRPVAYIEGIYVRKAYRKAGYATQMINFAENWARDQGVFELASDTEIENVDSQLFHKKAGFREVNKVVQFIKNIEQ